MSADDRTTPGPWRVESEPVVAHTGHTFMTHRIVTAYDHPQLKGPMTVVGIGVSMSPDKKPQHNVWMTRADAERIARVPDLERELAAARRDAERLEFLLDCEVESACKYIPIDAAEFKAKRRASIDRQIQEKADE